MNKEAIMWPFYFLNRSDEKALESFQYHPGRIHCLDGVVVGKESREYARPVRGVSFGDFVKSWEDDRFSFGDIVVAASSSPAVYMAMGTVYCFEQGIGSLPGELWDEAQHISYGYEFASMPVGDTLFHEKSAVVRLTLLGLMSDNLKINLVMARLIDIAESVGLNQPWGDIPYGNSIRHSRSAVKNGHCSMTPAACDPRIVIVEASNGTGLLNDVILAGLCAAPFVLAKDVDMCGSPSYRLYHSSPHLIDHQVVNEQWYTATGTMWSRQSDGYMPHLSPTMEPEALARVISGAISPKLTVV